MHPYIRTWYTIYNPDIQSIPYTLNKRYTTLTSKLQQVGINRAGQPLTKTVLRLDGGQKKPAGKNPFGEKTTTGNLGRNHGPLQRLKIEGGGGGGGGVASPCTPAHCPGSALCDHWH